jgi:6-pyruvoyltetrahydropterin/6-carboxytetrahydropterin synthase
VEVKFADAQDIGVEVTTMYKISKRFDFCASHQLRGLPDNHQCARLHGHNYSVTVHLVSDDLSGPGFVRDYGELDVLVKQWLDDHFEHRHLNDVVPFNPTAENLALFLYSQFLPLIPELVAVTVKETDKTGATYSPKRLLTFSNT